MRWSSSARLLAAAFLAVATPWPGGSTAGEVRELRLERIEVEPSGGGEDATVRLLLGLAPGDPVDAPGLAQARSRLESSGYFHRVSLYTSRGEAPATVVLHVQAELDRSPHLETGFGYEPLTGWYLNLVGVRWNNPLRRADHVRLDAQLGLRRGGFYASTAQPGLLGRHRDLLVSLGSEAEQWYVYQQDALRRQEIQRGLAHLGIAWRVARGLRAVLWAGVSSARPDSVLRGVGDVEDESAGDLVPPVHGRDTYGDLRLDVTVDGRDLHQPWRRGRWLGLRLRGSSVRDGAPFWRADADGRLLVPLPATSSLALRARGIYAGPAVPYHLRPIFGGTDTVRGFRDASLSGPLGARAVWHANAELRVPLLPRASSHPRVLGIAFAELGDHWTAEGRRAGVSAGAGYGLRVRVPWIQIFGLDVGIPLTPTTTNDPFWVHVSLGMSF